MRGIKPNTHLSQFINSPKKKKKTELDVHVGVLPTTHIIGEGGWIFGQFFIPVDPPAKRVPWYNSKTFKKSQKLPMRTVISAFENAANYSNSIIHSNILDWNQNRTKPAYFVQ